MAKRCVSNIKKGGATSQLGKAVVGPTHAPKFSSQGVDPAEVDIAGFSAPTFDGALPLRQLRGRRERDISDRTHTVPNRGTCRRRRLLTLPTEKRHCDVPHGDVHCHLLRLRLSDQVRDTVVSMTERENPSILPFEETSSRPRQSSYRMDIYQGRSAGTGECSHCHMWPTLEKKNGSRWTNHPFRGNFICTWLGEEPSVFRHVAQGQCFLLRIVHALAVLGADLDTESVLPCECGHPLGVEEQIHVPNGAMYPKFCSDDMEPLPWPSAETNYPSAESAENTELF